MQQAAAKRVAVPKVSLFGAGITYMLFAEPLRMGEYGPLLGSQRRPHEVV